jgi:Periplasmic component of the Tol biopolymer transport system
MPVTADLDRHFPRYTLHDPQVPVWCLTPHAGHCTHRFFDTSPLSPSGRYLAVLRLPFEDRLPAPGDVAHVVLVDLHTGAETVVADTRGWEHQLGANINWGGSDHELFFNDVDTASWTPFAWKLDPLSGERLRMQGTVYHASPDGRWLVSANLALMRKTQSGYGVVLPDSATPPWRVGPAGDDGFWLTDTRDGTRRPLVSVKQILKSVAANGTPVRFDAVPPPAGPERCEITGFHCKFNPQGDTLMLSLRWFAAGDAPRWDMFAVDFHAVRYAWVTLRIDPAAGAPDLASLRCATGPELWQHPGHHATWFPDGRRISQNLALPSTGTGDRLRLVEVNADGSGLRVIPGTENLDGSGHPTVHPDGVHLLADTYVRESPLGDGTVPLRWIDLRTGREQCLVRINALNPAVSAHSALRCDPHPAWDRDWTHVVFNGMDGDTRRVYIADMRPALGRAAG